MKYLIFALVALLPLANAHGAPPPSDLVQVTRALVNNPQIAERLKENNSANLIDFQIREEKQGIIHYRLVFNRQCECLPSTAIVKIREDLTPTYRDGQIEYTSSIEIKNSQISN